MENDYSDLLFDPELHDYNDDGVIDQDEYIMGYLEEEYECEQIFGRNSPNRRGFSLGELAALSMLLLLIDIIFDGIFGGRHSRVGKRMRGGGYRKRSSGRYGGGFFASIFAAALVGCVAALWSHPRTKHNGFRRSMFKRQPAPKPPKAARHISKSGSSNGIKRDAASTTSQRVVRHETSAGKPPAPALEKTETDSHSAEKAPVTTPNVSSTASVGSTEQKAEQPEKKEPKPVQPKKGTTITTNRTASGTSRGGSWRQTCEDGSKYGLDPNNYDTEQQYLDALNTAKFADQFRF